MHCQGTEVILDQNYEHLAAVLSAHFPLEGIAEAIDLVRMHMELPQRRQRRENQRLYNCQPEADQFLAMDPTLNALGFMLIDLERLSQA